MWFLLICKFLEIFAKNWRIFGQKRHFFRFSGPFFRARFSVPDFTQKSISSQENHWIHLKIGINVPWGNFKRYREPFFDMLIFCHFMGRQGCRKGHLAKNYHLGKKCPFWQICRFLAENRPVFRENIQKFAN